ncbi:ABC transporter substrate-binding protein [Aerococcus urinae]
MKKKLQITLAALTSLALLAACSNGGNSNEKEAASSEQSEEVASQESQAEAPKENEDSVKKSDWSEEQPALVAGTLSLAEMTDALEIPLVGVTSHAPDQLPEDYRDLPKVGSGPKIDLETLAATEADYYLNNKKLEAMTRQQVEGAGVEPVYFDYTRYDDVKQTLLDIGKLAGRQDKAQNIVDDINVKEEEVLKGTEDLNGKTFVIIFNSEEGSSVASDDSYLASILEKLGLKNIADESLESGSSVITDGSLVNFSSEAIIDADPDYIISYSLSNVFNLKNKGTADENTSQEQIEAELQKPIWQETKAGKNDHIISLTSNDISINGGLGLAEDLALVKKALLGEE